MRDMADKSEAEVNAVDGLLGQVDVAFVVDTTGSMDPFIDEARERMRGIAREVAQRGQLDMRYAVVEYRDHPPQDESFAVRVHPFGGGSHLQKSLDGLSAHGGGDHPECVLDGLSAAAALPWREHAERLCFLVGDAPPHGMGGRGDAWPEGCPCGKTLESVAVQLLGARVELTALALTRETALTESFQKIARRLEGKYVGVGLAVPHGRAHGESPMASASAAVDCTRVVLEGSAGKVSRARTYMRTVTSMVSPTREKIAAEMGISEEEAEETETYLKKRGIKKDDDS